jgi:hypothetical protein
MGLVLTSLQTWAGRSTPNPYHLYYCGIYCISNNLFIVINNVIVVSLFQRILQQWKLLIVIIKVIIWFLYQFLKDQAVLEKLPVNKFIYCNQNWRPFFLSKPNLAYYSLNLAQNQLHMMLVVIILGYTIISIIN